MLSLLLKMHVQVTWLTMEHNTLVTLHVYTHATPDSREEET